MDNVIAEVKSRNDIVDVIGSYITLKKAGKHFNANCPFHKEKSPSFVVSPDRQMWYCFGACHEGGDVINFVMKYENLSFYEALQELAQRAGVQLTDVKFQDREWEKREVLYKINKMASMYFMHILHNTKFGETARAYLEKRQVNEKIVKTFELGYAPESWESLYKFLKSKKFADEDIDRTGLVVKGKRGFYDRFRGRLIFPIKDSRENIIGFSGRILTGEKEAKYINIPETEIYHKRESLYGIHITKDEIRKAGAILVVEGEFDVIGPYQHGIGNIVAIKGSSVTKDHLRILKRYAQKIVLCLDADAAGQDAVMRTIKEAEEMNIEIYVMEIPDGKDPDDAVRNNLLGFKKALRELLPAHDYIIKTISKKYDMKNPYEKKHAFDELLPFLGYITNTILLTHYIKEAAFLFDTPEDDIREELEKYLKKRNSGNLRFVQTVEKPVKTSFSKEEKEERFILSSIFQCENSYELAMKAFKYLKPEDFTVRTLGLIFEHLQTYCAEKSSYNKNDFHNYLPGELREMFLELELDNSVHNDIEVNIEIPALEMKKRVLSHKLRELDKDEENERTDELRQRISSQLSDIRKLLDVKTGKR